MRSLWRIAVGAVIAATACALVAVALLALPEQVAVGCVFTGFLLFLVGARAGWRWPVAVSGVLMFAGVFAAALSGVLG